MECMSILFLDHECFKITGIFFRGYILQFMKAALLKKCSTFIFKNTFKTENFIQSFGTVSSAERKVYIHKSDL